MADFSISKRNGQFITEEMVASARNSVHLAKIPTQPVEIIKALAGPYDERKATYYARGRLHSTINTIRSVFDIALCFRRYFGTPYGRVIEGLNYLAQEDVNYVKKSYCSTIRKTTVVTARGGYRWSQDIKTELTKEQIKTFNKIILGE